MHLLLHMQFHYIKAPLFFSGIGLLAGTVPQNSVYEII